MTTASNPINTIEATIAKWREAEWTKCPDCGAEVQLWWAPSGWRFRYFSNGGKEHSRVCPMKQGFNSTTDTIRVYDSPVSYPLVYDSEVIVETKPKLPIAPPAGKRKINLNED